MIKPDAIRLHQLLSEFEEHLTRKEIPPRWHGDDLDAIHEVLKLIENETPNLYEH